MRKPFTERKTCQIQHNIVFDCFGVINFVNKGSQSVFKGYAEDKK